MTKYRKQFNDLPTSNNKCEKQNKKTYLNENS